MSQFVPNISSICLSADANEARMPIHASLKAVCSSLKSDVKLPPGNFCGWLIIFSAQIVTLAGNQPFIYKEIKFKFDEDKHYLSIPMGGVSVIRSQEKKGLVMAICKNFNNSSSESDENVKSASLAFTHQLNRLRFDLIITGLLQTTLCQ